MNTVKNIPIPQLEGNCRVAEQKLVPLEDIWSMEFNNNNNYYYYYYYHYHHVKGS
jgi:hypothetical protein